MTNNQHVGLFLQDGVNLCSPGSQSTEQKALKYTVNQYTDEVAALSVCVTVTAAGLLTGLDIWSESSAGGALPFDPAALRHAPRAPWQMWLTEADFPAAWQLVTPCPCPCPPSLPPHTQAQRLHLQDIISCCSSSSSTVSSPGRFINGLRQLHPLPVIGIINLLPSPPMCTDDGPVKQLVRVSRRTVCVSGDDHTGTCEVCLLWHDYCSFVYH